MFTNFPAILLPGFPDITINNIQTASVAAGNTININDYVINASVLNRILVAVVAGEDDPYDMTGISMTYGGNAMTEFASGFNTVGTTIRAFSDIFYMIAPPAGTTDDLVVSLAATTTVLSGSVWLFYLGNAKQQAPTNTTNNTATSSPITTNITPSVMNGLILDIIACGNVSNFTATGTNHTLGAVEIDQSSSTVAFGKLPFSSQVQQTPSWTNSSVNRMAQSVAVFERVAGPTVIPDMSNGTLITTTGAGSRTVPAGVTSIDIEIWGGGGSGAVTGFGGPSGGASTGYCKRISKTVSSGDVISFNIGVGGAAMAASNGVGNAGIDTTCNSMTAGGGGGGLIGSPSVGGTATGGDTNTTGNAGAILGNGGDAPNGGAGGASGTPGIIGGTPGAGGGPGAGNNATSGAGAVGGVKFSW